jgi:hypothetical protein
MRPRISKEEIIPVGSYSAAQFEGMMLPRAEIVKDYVGTIEIPGIAKGTACLLEDGKILTCLHNILDYNALADGRAQTIDFSRYAVSVYFVKNGNIYQYRINEAVTTGLDKLKAYGMRAMCFDYALLTTEGSPASDLGGGLKPDKTDHWGSESASDPARTLAVSGPFLTKVAGRFQVHRFVSLANNEAARSTYYHITQSGEHPSAPGFSGMAIVPATTMDNTLYAIHSYRDHQGIQNGTKVSEIRSSIDSRVSAASLEIDPDVYQTLISWYEVLTEATRKMDGSIARREKEITFYEAVEILRRGGDIAGDSRKEAESVSHAAWGTRGKLVRHDVHTDTPKGQPHFHHPLHTEGSYLGHAFYPSPTPILRQEAKPLPTKVLAAIEARKAKEAAAKLTTSGGGVGHK